MNDPIKQGLASGWLHLDASTFSDDQQFETDVVIIGTGAGGGMAAEILTQAGLSVLMLEHGALHSSSDFRQQERWAYPHLYQDGAARKTKDQAIAILQGRTVGGSTTVNWTTSIRTPKPTLDYWHSEFGLDFRQEHGQEQGAEQSTGQGGEHASEQSLDPYFAKAAGRLHISEWQVPPNANNEALRRGCQHLGWQYTVIERNVHGCANLGYCGMGCPLNAKQSMLVTTIPAALQAGATLISKVSARQLLWQGDKVTGLLAVPVDSAYQPDPRLTIKIKAKHYIVAGGAINSPALLLRSKVPNPSGRLGKHTYLHPSVISGALFDAPIQGHLGAPQSIYSDQFVWPTGAEMGFKLEVPPIHPVLMASTLTGMAQFHADMMRQFNQLQVMIALLRDGFDPQAQGGQVQLDSDGEPVLDYPLTDYIWQGVQKAYLAMAELQFAAGARAVMPVHQDALLYSSWQQAKAAIANLPLAHYRAALASAHVMGGCNMAASAEKGVVDSYGNHHQLANLSVFDGSVLPTSLGANPQLTIYGLIWRNSQALVARLVG
ncbi:GMC family oxidoreductase [Rheinheimera sp. SA_1]|uniref:GMC family oxidoreductase n=1 Tax=Rheinheimera sp. SA_1 TaxID=1827365 RepID=UPI0007FDC495|nr:GMC family oxidoreductase [Rheinheimera sp. SA_1]OBP13278.1 GMC family oxidoreductase [Rheinheimera sp. SA_1]